MTGRLALLHVRLARLRRARAAVVVLSAAAGMAAAVLATLFVVFLLDWLFGLDVLQRLIVLALAGGALFYFARKFWRESGRRRGGEIQTALWVERQQQIDSDLVAAIQFERAGAGDLTSRRLAAAVVEYVAEAAPAINVFQGFSPGPLFKRVGLLAAFVALGVALVVFVPNHLKAFSQRLLLGSQAYPTRTLIERVSVGEAVVFERSQQESAALAEAKAAEAGPLRFSIVCEGAIPRAAVAHVRPVESSGPGTRIPLKAATSGEQANVLSGELPRVHEDVQYWITAGDARTETGLVRMIPLPTVEVEVRATPPAYAVVESTQNQDESSGDSVLEGSAVEIVAVCTNGKALQTVELHLQGAAGAPQIELTPLDERKTRWTLPQGDSSLAAIRGDVRYELQATDVDGLSPLVPVRGVIRVHPDAPPTAAASVVHRLVLPSAQPVIQYRAADDQGITRLVLAVDIERAAAGASEVVPGEQTSSEPTTAATPQIVAESRRIDIPLPSKVVRGDQLPLAGSYAFGLGPLRLAKGDRIKMTLEASDYRGESAAGATAASDSLVLEVADESAVLGAIRQADERSEAQLNEIIRRQLGVGQEP